METLNTKERELAAALVDAEQNGGVVVLARGKQLAAGAGYVTQELEHALRVASGETLAGFKVGLTVSEAQQNFGTNRPGYGRLYTSMLSSGEDVVPVTDAPNAVGMECEVAVSLRADLSAAEISALLADEGTAREAIAAVHVAAEIVTSRWNERSSTWEPWCADNGNSFRAVLGAAIPEADPAQSFQGALTVNGTRIQGASQQVVAMLRWLDQALRDTTTPLFPGAVVLTGALVGPVWLTPGDDAEAEVTGLGSVHVSAR